MNYKILLLWHDYCFFKNGMKMQQTIKDKITFSGIGLHTGCRVNVSILPAPEDAGITFIRKDLPGSPAIKASPSNVVATSYATTLGVNGVTVSTVEHLLAAFYGLGVDNAVVELDGPEAPIMDGSASHFIERIDAVGRKGQARPRRYIVIKKPIKVFDRDKYVLLLPALDDALTIDYNIDFSHSFIARQSFTRLFSRDMFRHEVGNARTFGFLSDVEMLKANGLAKGGSLDNAVVIGETDILNEEGLRYPDEFVRHKVLDMMGDISILGYPLIARIVAHRSGHALNYKLVQEILQRPNAWELTEEARREAQAMPQALMGMGSLAAV